MTVQSADHKENTILSDTRKAFDKVAGRYDGPLGNNDLIQRLREQFREEVKGSFEMGDRLLDLGCGTGLDAVEMAREGFRITAVDWSPEMVQKTKQKAEEKGLSDLVECYNLGGHQLNQLSAEKFNGIYSNLGVLNCVLNQNQLATQCSNLLVPGGRMVASVIGRICPWEIGFYLAKGAWKRALIRLKKKAVAVNMEGEKVWTCYFTPRELFRYYKGRFNLELIRSMNLFTPPPYMLEWYRKRPKLFEKLESIDRRVGHWFLLRNLGDHFLIRMRKQ